MNLVNKIKPSRKLNTKGCCFICLQSENIVKTEELDGSQVLKTISIQNLLRHLQIPTAQPLDEKSIFGNSFKHDIQVDLCETCGQMISRFSVLFQKLEKIQLEMDYFLEKIHKSISQSAKVTELVQNYSKRMTNDLEALSQLAFVDNLRKQISKKCLSKADVPRPQLLLTRADIKIVKTEKSDETCESNDGDFPGDTFAGDVSPPLSPNSTADHKEEEELKFSKSATASTLKELLSPPPKLPVKLNTRKSKYHTKDYSTGMYECKKCDKKSKRDKTIAEHFKSVHLKQRYKCDICNIADFSLLCSLKQHKKTCQKKLEKKLEKEKDPKFKFICKICGKRFEAKLKLREHKRWVHKNANRFQCDLCDKKYTSKVTLKDHQAAIHQSRKFYCKICNKMYMAKRTFRKHEKKCVDNVKINISSASTSQGNEKLSPSLNPPIKHNTNTGKYYTRTPSTGMYECKKCDKISKSPHTIAYHYKGIHLKLRFKCNICNIFDFTHYSSLHAHKKTCRENLPNCL